MRILKSVVLALSLVIVAPAVIAEQDGDCEGVELLVLESDVRDNVLAEGADQYHDVLAAFNFDIDIALMLASNN